MLPETIYTTKTDTYAEALKDLTNRGFVYDRTETINNHIFEFFYEGVGTYRMKCATLSFDNDFQQWMIKSWQK